MEISDSYAGILVYLFFFLSFLFWFSYVSCVSFLAYPTGKQ
jgi:hypothetical protein